MLKTIAQFSLMASLERVDAEKGIIYGVSVITLGEAKGHGMVIDHKTLDQVLQVARTHKNGLKVKFGDDHAAGVADINGTLRNFRIDGNCVRADLHLLKSDKNFQKLVELSLAAPEEFGISLSFSGNHEKMSYETKVRCSEIYSADIVSDPAANPNGLFSIQNNQTMKKLALSLGLAESATELEIEAKITQLKAEACKYEAEEKKKKELEAEAEKKKMSEANGDNDKFTAMEAEITKLSALFADSQKAQLEAKSAAETAVKLAEIKGLVADASRDGKVVPLSEAELCALSIDSVKTMLSKLPKNTIKLASQKSAVKLEKDGKVLDKHSPEFVTQLRALKEANAVELNSLFN